MTTALDDPIFWDRAARKHARSPIKDLAGYDRTIARTIELLKGPKSVLEIGCGTGMTALKLAPAVGRIVATDVSGEMIAIAGEKAEALDCRNAEFSVGSVEEALTHNGSYDAVLAFNLLHLIAQRRSILEQIHRKLKPGGLFISKTPCLSEMNSLIRLAVPPMRWIGLAPHVDFFTAVELEEEIANAGFEITERARHGSKPRDARIFLVARRT